MSFIINGNIYIKTPLLRTIDTNNLTLFKKLIEEGESMYSSSEDNQIILLYIFYKKNLKFLELYFHYKYNIKNGVIKNIFPFFYSFNNFYLYKELFNMLLCNGLNVNFLYEKYQYKKRNKKEYRRIETIDNQITNFSTMNEENNQELMNREEIENIEQELSFIIVKESLLFNCCRDNQYYIVEKLLEFGADPWIKNFEGKTPLDIAKEKKYDRLVKLLQKYE